MKFRTLGALIPTVPLPIMTENLASFAFFHAEFQLDRFTPLRLRASYIGLVTKPKNLTEFDLLTLTFYRERELRRWQPGVSGTLDHGDTS